MTFITILYVAAVAVGVAWVIFRVVVYLRAERARERRISAEIVMDEQFKDYLKELAVQSESPDPDHVPNEDSKEETGSQT